VEEGEGVQRSDGLRTSNVTIKVQGKELGVAGQKSTFMESCKNKPKSTLTKDCSPGDDEDCL